ncbi:hypothetical protein M5K25_010345 [Dendrobium thyrsiflorum]|uniref:Pentatricopeptide repeat-containing protein n=1 Tax=Dendrobium thyrsiflorum TaxID=117978 RepID=A0ABD0V6Z5_DENTH
MVPTLLSTISSSVLPYILHLSTSREIWKTLELRLQPSNHSRVIQLKNELNHIHMRDSTMTQYLSQIKTLVDNIKSAGSHINTEDVILYIMNGLMSTYNQIKICHSNLPAAHKLRCSLFSSLQQRDLAVLQLGQQVRGLVLKPGFDSNDFVSSSLIYLYSKCGIIADAKKSFDESCKDGSVTWNSIILGYAQHGLGEIALDLFHEMQEFGVEADHITFVDLFFACSHSGLVKGTKILKSIQPAYGITLRMEHFACGVDIFGRAGMVEEAYRFIIEGMLVGLRPNARAWDALLSRSYCNVESRKIVARCLRDVEPLIKFLPTKADGDKWKHPLSSFQIFDPGGLITTSTCR